MLKVVQGPHSNLATILTNPTLSKISGFDPLQNELLFPCPFSPFTCNPHPVEETWWKPNLFFSKFLFSCWFLIFMFLLLLRDHFHKFSGSLMMTRICTSPSFWPWFALFWCNSHFNYLIQSVALPPPFTAHTPSLMHALLHPYSSFPQIITILLNLQRGKQHALFCR